MASSNKSKVGKNRVEIRNFTADPKLPRRRTASIRCVFDCVKALNEKKELPRALCYVPLTEVYHCVPNTPLQIYDTPSKHGKKIREFRIPSSPSHITNSIPSCIITSGEEFTNRHGKWLKVKLIETGSSTITYPQQAWVLLYSVENPEGTIPLMKCGQTITDDTDSSLLVIRQPCCERLSLSWEDMVERAYSLGSSPVVGSKNNEDMDAMTKLQVPCRNWTLECDAELARFLSDLSEPDNENYGSIKNLVESIQVSSTTDDGVEQLTDDDPDTYWESDGSQGQHWIRLRMKKGTIIRRMLLALDGDDGNYIPYHIIVMAGETSNLKKIQDMYIDLSFSDVQDICILEDTNQHYPVIEIRIKECKDDGIDTRVHGIKIKSSKERDIGLHADVFTSQALVRFPLLEGFSKEILYRRGIALQRFTTMLDSVLPYLMPQWEFSIGTFKKLLGVRHLLPLSKKRTSLIDTLLKESETPKPEQMPKLFINRRGAAEHKLDPASDPECRLTVFMQIFEGLKPKDRYDKSLDYRWPTRYSQWWECKFLAEGIIDQGGGFRDSLSDISEELCPGSGDVPMPLPLFIRAPNQSTEDSNVNRDVYIPNPSFKDYKKYHWIGQLMGACFRGKESLVMSLPSFTWKQLGGEQVTWSRDFISVDAADVKLIERIESCDKEAYDAHFGDWLCWTTSRSDGTPVPLRGAENSTDLVPFEERCDYSKKVQAVRMSESANQMEAIRKGLLEVVPESVLELITWQELERRVCGDPEIGVEALRKSTRCDDLDENCTRMKYLWEALSNFSNEDRSRYLRFVTGRRRLPAYIYVCPGRDIGLDALPESSTCSNTLFLPNYTAASVTEEKLRYAVYNCVAIDTDMSPWDE